VENQVGGGLPQIRQDCFKSGSIAVNVGYYCDAHCGSSTPEWHYDITNPARLCADSGAAEHLAIPFEGVKFRPTRQLARKNLGDAFKRPLGFTW
jgi:hypothetical protein